MKTKIILRHFWRNNKKFVSMYLTFCEIVFVAITACMADFKGMIYNIALFCVWYVIWCQEREIDIRIRAHKRNKEWTKRRIREWSHKSYIRGYKNCESFFKPFFEHIRNVKSFYCQGVEASWEDMYDLIGKEAMMHDFPYYFDKDGNDIYPQMDI